MVKYEERKTEHLVGITCDVCKKEYSSDDYSEYLEFVQVNDTGGYGSIFGDGLKMQIDICQHCFKHMLEAVGLDVQHYIQTQEWRKK